MAGHLGIRDKLGRPVRDLRISVTDKCNFRCTYCMPKDVFGRDYEFLPREAILTFEEIERLGRIFAGLGVRKIRLTGGEPLLRRDIERLVAMLAAIPGVEIALTTNGALLAPKARVLRNAGCDRLTVSLDSLDNNVFKAMNDVDFPVDRVLDGIDAAVKVGFHPVKINTVVRRGLNEDEVVPLARYFRARGHVIRFIEYMDVGSTNRWRRDDIVPASEIAARIDRALPLEPIPSGYQGEVATRFRYKDGCGEVGVIASVTNPFCGDCTRARLSADGSLFTCLFATQGHDLRALLRGGADDAEIARVIGSVWARREDRYSELRAEQPVTAGAPKIEMSYIGG